MFKLVLGLSLLLLGWQADDAASKANAEQPEKKPSLRLRRKSADTPKQTKPAEEEAPPKAEDRGIPSPEARPEKPTDLDKQLLEGLGQDLEQVPEEGAESDPLMRVGKRMRDSEELLAKLDASENTIEIQKKILEDLDELLKQAQNNQNNQNNQNQQQQQRQQNPQQQQQEQQQQQGQEEQQQQDAKDAAKQAGAPRPALARAQQPADPLQTKDIWGHLSEMMREEMSQYAKEGFLPKYREMLEKYYSNIAERSRSTD